MICELVNCVICELVECVICELVEWVICECNGVGEFASHDVVFISIHDQLMLQRTMKL